MSEPTARASRVTKVTPGLWHWSLHDDRIDFRSDAHAVQGEAGVVLIDPLPLTHAALARLGVVEAIVLTGSCHQRSAWRYRRMLRAPVYAPRGAKGFEEKPDFAYGTRAGLPGGLVAIHAPGPTLVHFALLRKAGRGVLFCADILMSDRGAVRFIDDAYQDNPQRTRVTARGFLSLGFGILCFNHGAPSVRDAKRAIRGALARDGT